MCFYEYAPILANISIQKSASVGSPQYNRFESQGTAKQTFLLKCIYHEFDKSGFLLEIIDGRELPEYMTMNKGKICG